MTKLPEMNIVEAMAIIGRLSSRGESADEEIVKRGAELMGEGRRLGIEAFAQFAMHLDPGSPFALEYHVYAHIQYNEEDWTLIGQLARVGTPLRDIGQNPEIRRQVVHARNGGAVVPDSHYRQVLEMFCSDKDAEPSEALKKAIAKLKQAAV